MILADLMKMYQLNNDSIDFYHIFKDIELDERIDKNVLFTNIFLKAGALTPLMNVTETFKMFSDNFFKKHALTITELMDTLEYEYNPIDNYNRVEETTNTQEGEATSNGNSTAVGKVSAYDSFEMLDNNEQSNTSGATSTSNNTVTNVSTIKGNIGVMSTQQMIEQQRKTVQFNVIEWITDKYSMELFLSVF